MMRSTIIRGAYRLCQGILARMKLTAAVLVCACHSSTRPVEPVPLPPTEAEQAANEARQDAAVVQDISTWPAYPTIAPPPTSHPSGAPIALPAGAAKVG